MARHLLALLALGQCATAILDGYVTVNIVREDVVLGGNFNVKVVNNVIVAAEDTDPEISACATADVVLSLCASSGVLETTVPIASAVDCLCCYGGSEIVDEYSSCATYIAKSFPTESAAFSTVSLLYDICAPETCRASASPQTTTRFTAPAACTSFVNIYSSCSIKLGGFSTVPLSSAASCLCYDKLGYNTKFDDYASSCAPFAKTAVPEDYSVISALATFCEDFPPRTGAGNDIVPSITESIGGLGVSSTSSVGPTSTITVTTQAGLATPGVVVPGAFAWLANLATLIFSFFMLL